MDELHKKLREYKRDSRFYNESNYFFMLRFTEDAISLLEEMERKRNRILTSWKGSWTNVTRKEFTEFVMLSESINELVTMIGEQSGVLRETFVKFTIDKHLSQCDQIKEKMEVFKKRLANRKAIHKESVKLVRALSADYKRLFPNANLNAKIENIHFLGEIAKEKQTPLQKRANTESLTDSEIDEILGQD